MNDTWFGAMLEIGRVVLAFYAVGAVIFAVFYLVARYVFGLE